MNQTKTKGGFSFVGFVKGLSAICGFGFIICCLVNMLLGLGFQAGIILVCGLGTGWVLQALQRRFCQALFRRGGWLGLTGRDHANGAHGGFPLCYRWHALGRDSLPAFRSVAPLVVDLPMTCMEPP